MARRIAAAVFIVIFSLTFFLLIAKCEEIMTVTLTPTFLRYNSKVSALFNIDPPCPLTSKLVLYSDKSTDWQGDDSTKSEYFSRPNSSSISIEKLDYSHASTFYAHCITSGSHYQAALKIPVAPQVLGIKVIDAGKRSKMKSPPVTSSDGYRTYYEFWAFFDEETTFEATKLQIDAGDGYSENKVGTLTLKGDTGLIVSQKVTPSVINKEPNYPNGTTYPFVMSSFKWSELPEPKCTANLTARTAIISSLRSDNEILWHEANIILDLNYKAQILKATATTSKSTTCEIACEVNSACPYVDVTLTLELFDSLNNSLGRNSVIKTSRNNRVVINALKLDTCKMLVSLAKSKAGLAVCSVTNSVGTKTKYWVLDEVTDLAALLLSDELFNWWEILLIVLSCVFFVIIIVFIIGCIICKCRHSKDDPKKGRVYMPSQPPPHRQPVNNNTEKTTLPLKPDQEQPPVQQYQMQATQPLQFQQLQQRPNSQAGSSFYGGRYTGEYDSPFTQQPTEPLPSDYRSIQFANTPRSRQPIIAGPPPAGIPEESGDTSYDNPAFTRTPGLQRSFRAEAIV